MSLSHCPHCGVWQQQRDDPLDLTPRQRQIFDLVKKRPRSREQLWTVLYESNLNDGPTAKVIHVLIYQLNRRLRRYGMAIRCDCRGPYMGTYYLADLINADPILESA